MPTKIPLEIYSKERVLTEILIEEFLFFSVSAIDILFQDVNNKLKLDILSNQVRPNSLVKALKVIEKREARAILGYLLQNFQEPKHVEKRISDEEFNEESSKLDNALDFFTEYENRNRVKYRHFWDRSKSRLWELRNQRNTITHESLLKDAGLRGTVEPKDYLRVRLVYNDQPTRMWDSIHVENPKEYYSEALTHVKQFVKAIQDILNSVKT